VFTIIILLAFLGIWSLKLYIKFRRWLNRVEIVLKVWHFLILSLVGLVSWLASLGCVTWYTLCLSFETCWNKVIVVCVNDINYVLLNLFKALSVLTNFVFYHQGEKGLNLLVGEWVIMNLNMVDGLSWAFVS